MIRDPNRWCVGAYHNRDQDQYCMAGAIQRTLWLRRANIAPRSEAPRRAAYNRILKALHKTAIELSSKDSPIGDFLRRNYANANFYPQAFNDARDTTHDDVINVMDKTRAKLEEMGE